MYVHPLHMYVHIHSMIVLNTTEKYILKSKFDNKKKPCTDLNWISGTWQNALVRLKKKTPAVFNYILIQYYCRNKNNRPVQTHNETSEFNKPIDLFWKHQ